MFATRVYHYRQPAAVILGLKDLRKQGLTPRGLLFVALDPRGETYIVVPEDLDAVESIRVGDKLSLVSPLEGRYFHLDAVHRLPGDQVLWNGDRRLSDIGSAPEVAAAISAWLKGSSARNVFLGCTPHVPGSWWTVDHRSPVTDLHSLGFLDCVVATHGILARKIDDPRLFLLGFTTLAQNGHPGKGWIEVFTSELGNIVLVERRVLHYRIVLTCERGLLEIDISHLPDLVIETARVPMRSGFGVVGRVDHGAFAVTMGTIESWGLTNMGPATLVGSSLPSLLELPRMLRAMPDDEPTSEPDAEPDDPL
ncbi:MAG TPA: hypothetical protein VHW23_35380 [Kofleriaceae bacterium]|jgi:hypothetical protein|nr:hypothetical protein [Kofleriaceae bacterium]